MKKTLASLVVVLLSIAGAHGEDRSPVDRCDEAVRAAPEALESYLCFYTVFRRHEPYRGEAVRRLEAYLSLRPVNHRARLALAAIEGSRGSERAVDLYRESVDGFAAEDLVVEEVRGRINLASLLSRRGRRDEADAELVRAAERAERADDGILLARVRHVQGQQAYFRQDYARATRRFQEVESAVFPDGPALMQARCLSFLGSIATATGQSAKAMDYHRRHAEVERRAGNAHGEARALGNVAALASYRWGIGEIERDTAFGLAARAVEAARESGNRNALAWALHHLGSLSSGEEAEHHFRESLAISREIADAKVIGLALRALALHLARHREVVGESLDLADEALAVAGSIGDRSEIARARIVRAELSWVQGSRERYVAQALESLEAIEAVRDQQPDDLVRARFLSQWAFAYLRLSGRILDVPGGPTVEDLELAFAVTERMRARTLLDALDRARATAALEPEGEPSDRRRELLDTLAGVQRRLLAPELPPEERREALAELGRLERAEAELRETIARDSPSFARLRRPELPGLADVREALRADEALLSYQISTQRNRNVTMQGGFSDGGSRLLVLTRDGQRVYDLPDRLDLEPAVELFPGILRRRDGLEAIPATRIFEHLLAAPLADLPSSVDRLVIVPDAALHRLPFAALRAGPEELPIGATHRISLAPSVSTWLRWRRSAPATAEAPVLALADPEPPPGSAEQSVAPARERAWALATGERIGTLPRARVEARDAARRLGGESVLLLGDQASERYLKQADFGQFAIVHFAVHALLDDEYPERSALLLSPGAASEDGLLQLREIVELDLDGRIVVLSACRSASGDVLQGEGVMGLARAFFQAGASTVIGSLWSIRDDEAQHFFDLFYSRLGRGASVAEAFGETRRTFARSGEPTAAWAGIVLLGDGEAVPLPGGGSDRSGLLVFVVGLAVVVILIVLRATLRRQA